MLLELHVLIALAIAAADRLCQWRRSHRTASQKLHCSNCRLRFQLYSAARTERCLLFNTASVRKNY